MIKRAPRAPRNRTRLPNNFQPTVPAMTWTAAISAGDALITTALPYTLVSLPLGIKVQSVSPLTITQVSTNSFKLHYAAAVVATNVIVVPANEPGIRNNTGGYLASGTFTF